MEQREEKVQGEVEQVREGLCFLHPFEHIEWNREQHNEITKNTERTRVLTRREYSRVSSRKTGEKLDC